MVTFATDQPFGVCRPGARSADPLARGYFNFCPSETWTPAVNLYESDAAYHVCVDLAGVDKDKIEVEIVERQLTLRGTRLVPISADASPPAAPRMRVHLMEIDHGAFCRQVELPVDVERIAISAKYRDGYLWIELPKLT